jgi:hypothetical protein
LVALPGFHISKAIPVRPWGFDRDQVMLRGAG